MGRRALGHIIPGEGETVSAAGSRDRYRPDIVVAGALTTSLAVAIWLGWPSLATLGGLATALGAFSTVVLVGTVIAAVSALRGGSLAFAMMMGTHAFWFAIPMSASSLGGGHVGGQAGLPPVQDRHVEAAIWAVSMFFVVSVGVFSVTDRLISKSRVIGTFVERMDLSTLRHWPAVLSFFFVGIFPFFAYGGSLASIVSGILSSRSVQRDWVFAAFSSNPLMVAGRAALALAAVLALDLAIRSARYRVLATSVFFVSFLVTYFDSGTRTWVALILGPASLLGLRAAIRRHILRRWVVLGPMLVVSTLWITEAQRNIRVIGAQSEAIRDVMPTVSDNDFFTETAVAMSVVPEQYGFLHESTAWLFLTNPIPRAIWPEKPYPRVIRTYGIGRRGYDDFRDYGTTSMPSIVGQFHMNWGWWGVVEAGVFVGVIFSLVGVMWRKGRAGGWAELTGGVICAWAFSSFRVLLPGFHYTPVLLVLALWVLQPRHERLARQVSPLAAAKREAWP